MDTIGLNRRRFFDDITEMLIMLQRNIEIRGQLNLLDYHQHSEDFYAHFLNLVFGWKLTNMNSFMQNVEAIDLIDTVNELIVQVSATNTKVKVESALKKEILHDFSTFRFKFVSIAKDALQLRKNTFLNPHGLQFQKESDILDLASILREIKAKNINEQRAIYSLLREELGHSSEYDLRKLESNLAMIVGILAKENLREASTSIVKRFEIEQKLIHNRLQNLMTRISRYTEYGARLETVYSIYDREGYNKSLAILDKINSLYTKLNEGSDNLFLATIDLVIETIDSSSNRPELPIEELELCAWIIVVDAFVRCEIFENPNPIIYATA
jgi:hypothetical protein